MQKLSTRLKSKWGKYTTRLDRDTSPDVVAFQSWVTQLYKQETSSQLVCELAVTDDVSVKETPVKETPAKGKGRAAQNQQKNQRGNVHATTDNSPGPG